MRSRTLRLVMPSEGTSFPMPRQPQDPETEPHRRLVEPGRQLECEEDKGWFEEKPKRIAKAKLKSGPKKQS